MGNKNRPAVPVNHLFFRPGDLIEVNGLAERLESPDSKFIVLIVSKSVHARHYVVTVGADGAEVWSMFISHVSDRIIARL